MSNQRQQSVRRLAGLLAALAIIAGAFTIGVADAETPRERARRLYNEGNERFQAKDYRGAIGRFLAADRLAPAALLDYNVGLAYDKLGDKPKALRYFKSYLRRNPSAGNRGIVEGKINRLEGELRVDAESGANERRAAEEARAAEAARKAEEARTAAEVVPPANPDGAVPADPAPAEVEGNPAGAVPPAEVAPPAPRPASTGDPDLDRIAAVDIAMLRDSRNLQRAARPAASGTDDRGSADAPSPLGDRGDKKKKAKPVYKQWWFWVVVGVSAVILIDIASSDSSNAAQPLGNASSGVILRF